MFAPKRLFLTLVLPALLLVIFAVSTVAAGGPAEKVDVCHWANHKYVRVNISGNALDAHLRHGDVLVDEYGDCL